MKTPYAPTVTVLIAAFVNKDLLEMEQFVKVRVINTVFIIKSVPRS